MNILEDDAIRTGMKEYSQWPTFPQVYIGGEFYGGCDILIGTESTSARYIAGSRPLLTSLAPWSHLHLR